MKKPILTFALGICLLSIGRAQVTSGPLRAGDILYLDWGDAINGAYVVKFDPVTGQQTIVASRLNSPEAIAVDEHGQVLIASYSSIVRLDLATGTREVIADLSQFGSIWGLALAADGDIF